jgi:hypothetical protein
VACDRRQVFVFVVGERERDRQIACRIGDVAGGIDVGWIVVCGMDWMRWLEPARDGRARWRWW